MKISITLPNFNHGRYLRTNIESYLAQSYGNWELLILDDGSTDDSWNIIESYARLDKRIRAERFARNRGANVAMAHLLSACSGELVHLSSADDYAIETEFFKTAVEGLKKDSVAGLFGLSSVVEANSGKELWQMGGYPTTGIITADQATYDFLSGNLFIPGISTVWRRACISEVGGYDEALGPQSDYFVSHALALRYGVIHIGKVLTVSRLDRRSFSHSTDHENFFRRHALVEVKLRSLLAGRDIADERYKVWRESVISGRLSLFRQRRLVELYKEVIRGVQEWERGGLFPEYLECEDFLSTKCVELERRLTEFEALGRKIFDEIAGVIAPEQPDRPTGGLVRRFLTMARTAWNRVVSCLPH